MRFVRAMIHPGTLQVIGVLVQDYPFSGEAIHADDTECEVIDFGAMEDADFVDETGRPISPSAWVFTRIDTDHSEFPKVHDTPCSLDGIRARLREKGPEGIPIKVRAWLTMILPDEQVRELGPIWKGVPLSALAAMERLRNRRDPKSGSRIERIERAIQQQSDARSARALARRKQREAVAAESAWNEMIELIGEHDGEAVPPESHAQPDHGN